MLGSAAGHKLTVGGEPLSKDIMDKVVDRSQPFGTATLPGSGRPSKLDGRAKQLVREADGLSEGVNLLYGKEWSFPQMWLVQEGRKEKAEKKIPMPKRKRSYGQTRPKLNYMA